MANLHNFILVDELSYFFADVHIPNTCMKHFNKIKELNDYLSYENLIFEECLYKG